MVVASTHYFSGGIVYLAKQISLALSLYTGGVFNQTKNLMCCRWQDVFLLFVAVTTSPSLVPLMLIKCQRNSAGKATCVEGMDKQHFEADSEGSRHKIPSVLCLQKCSLTC